MACRVPVAEVIESMVGGAARIVEVSEDDVAGAMRLAFDATHNLAEPAGALALAGLLAERERARGRRVAVIQTGGNVDAPPSSRSSLA